jgi:hypothetical protein
MTALTDLISAGGGAGGGADKLNLLNPSSGLKVVFQESTTYTPSVDCTAVVTCIGAGASGGNSRGIASGYGATGGGAGGVCQSELNLTSGTTYTLTIGAGGAQSGYGGGNVGGNTTFTGSDITDMTANGGAAGSAFNSPIGHATQTAGGGNASGGNIANHTGGASISISSNGNGSAIGGGALGFFGTGKACSESGSNAISGANMDLVPIDLIPRPLLDQNYNTGGFANGDSGSLNGQVTAGNGAFGCGGGACNINVGYSGSGTAVAGKGGIGGGGGGAFSFAAAGYSASVNSTSGAGGEGMVILEFV